MREIVLSFAGLLFLTSFTGNRVSAIFNSRSDSFNRFVLNKTWNETWTEQLPWHGSGQLASPGGIRSAMILWGGSAEGLVETITPAALGNRKTWRITHYPQDPTETRTNDYDLYDLDRETLLPLRSIRNTEEYRLELTFAEKQVTVRKISGATISIESIPLSAAVQAEGPGLDVFVAGLPLASGYKTRYPIVDRWDGHGLGRVKMVTLSVSEMRAEETGIGKRSIYELLIKSDDGSFEIKEEVLTETPHFPVRVEYTRNGKTYPASTVIDLVTER